MRKKTGRRPVEVSSVLEKVMRNLGIAAQVKLVRIMTRWDKIFDPPVSRVTFPRALKGKTLFVDVADSVWLQQLTFMDRLLMDRINERFGSGTVGKVCFSIGPLPERHGGQESGPGMEWEAAALSNEDMDAVRECVEGIGDPELRKDLRRLMGKDRKLKKYRATKGNL